MLLGLGLGIAFSKKEMPKYTGPSDLDAARQSLDGSTQSIRQGMKNMLP